MISAAQASSAKAETPKPRNPKVETVGPGSLLRAGPHQNQSMSWVGFGVLLKPPILIADKVWPSAPHSALHTPSPLHMKTDVPCILLGGRGVLIDKPVFEQTCYQSNASQRGQNRGRLLEKGQDLYEL